MECLNAKMHSYAKQEKKSEQQDRKKKLIHYIVHLFRLLTLILYRPSRWHFNDRSPIYVVLHIFMQRTLSCVIIGLIFTEYNKVVSKWFHKNRLQNYFQCVYFPTFSSFPRNKQKKKINLHNYLQLYNKK